MTTVQVVQPENLDVADLRAQPTILHERVYAAVEALGHTHPRVRRSDVCAYLQNNHADAAYRPKQVDHALQALRRLKRVVHVPLSGWMALGEPITSAPGKPVKIDLGAEVLS